MKPWVFRIFDPRPPWWRNLITVAFTIMLLCLTPKRSGVDYSNLNRDFQIITPQRFAPPASADFHYNMSSTTYRDSVIVSEPVVICNSIRVDDPIAFLQSESAAAVELRKRLNEASLTDPNASGWHNSHIKHIFATTMKGEVHRIHWKPTITRWVRNTGLLVIGFLVVGLHFVYLRVRTRCDRIANRKCPRCMYNVHFNEFDACPECGLDLLRESKRLHALHTEGYRGLKQFLREDSEPA